MGGQEEVGTWIGIFYKKINKLKNEKKNNGMKEYSFQGDMANLLGNR